MPIFLNSLGKIYVNQKKGRNRATKSKEYPKKSRVGEECNTIIFLTSEKSLDMVRVSDPFQHHHLPSLACGSCFHVHIIAASLLGIRASRQEEGKTVSYRSV